jgi:hypothetical protein
MGGVMKLHSFGASAAMAALVTACGGGDSAPPTTYEFVAPQTGFQRVYAETLIDNSNNTINESYSQTVTDVNADGSYVLLEEPISAPIVVDGTTYSIPIETINVNNQSQNTSYSELEADGGTETCTYAPHGPGPGYPLTVGATWTIEYTVTCGTAAAITHTQDGNVLDVESVTVPAGTYTALKLQSTDTYTDAKGATISETTTNWRDIATLFSVKRTSTLVYSGTLPITGYAVSLQTVLQSETN